MAFALMQLVLTGCSGGGSSSDTTTEPSLLTLYSVSGAITAGVHSAVDSDINDPNASFLENNTSGQAQNLSNPVILGGFASAVATGVSDDVFASQPDVRDVYRVMLTAGQNVQLTVSDYSVLSPASQDLDLYLYATTDTINPVASSMGTNQSESVGVTTTGLYYVIVEAVTGATNYTLMIGQSILSTSAQSMRLEDEFVPGDVIVRLKDKITISPSATRTATEINSFSTSTGLKQKAGGPQRAMLMSLGESDVQRQVMRSALSINPMPDSEWGHLGKNSELRNKYETLRAIKALRARSDVESADPNYIRKAYVTPNDQYYPLQWHYPLINLPQAWDVTQGTPVTGQVIVAVVDTGVFLNHVDLTGNLLNTGYDFIENATNANDGDGIDSNPDDPGDSTTPGMSSFHGTHVSGTVAANTNDTAGGAGSGVAGVSWGAKIMPLRVLGLLGGTSYDIIQAIRYAARLPNDSGTVPPQKADIINLSLGGGGFSQIEENEYLAVRATGITIVAAAGNENTSTPSYPASYQGVVSVSAVDLNKERAYYSNFGTAVDVAGPGGDVRVDLNVDGYADGALSTLADDSSGTRVPVYAFYQGTSMASPHVAGVIALMKAVYPALTPDQFDALLSGGLITEDLAANGATTRDNNFGYGLIDAFEAVQQASDLAAGTPLPAVLGVDPSSLDFGSTLTEINFDLSNKVDEPMQVTSVTSDADWLSVSPSSIDANNLGTYSATVNRSTLSEANYYGTITITTDTAGTSTVFVSMRVGAPNLNGDVGVQWVNLIDSVTDDVIARTIVSGVNGQYSYSIDVPNGSYFVVSGSNLDNDGLICDPGESCGGYPDSSQPSVVQVNGADRTGIDFSSSYEAILGLSDPSVQDSVSEHGINIH